MLKFFIKSSKPHDNLYNVIDETGYIYLEKMGIKTDTEVEFSGDYLNLGKIREFTEDAKLKLDILIFDSEFGSASKKVYDCGFLTKDKNIDFNIANEANLLKESTETNTDFYKLLDLYIENNGVNTSPVPIEKSKISISIDYINNEDFLHWFFNQSNREFEVTKIDYELGLLWIKGCKIGIDICKCNLIK